MCCVSFGFYHFVLSGLEVGFHVEIGEQRKHEQVLRETDKQQVGRIAAISENQRQPEMCHQYHELDLQDTENKEDKSIFCCSFSL